LGFPSFSSPSPDIKALEDDLSAELFQEKGPPLAGWVSLDGGRVHLSPRFLEEARERGWDTLEGVCRPPQGEVVRSTPFRITSLEEGYFRKVHLRGWKGAGLRDRIRLGASTFLSPARVEVYWGERLGRLRIPTPVPVLLAEEGPRKGRSALVTRAVPGGRPLDGLAEPPPPPVLSEAARLVALLHSNGLVHRDLYLNHLVLDEGGELWLADLQRLLEPKFFFERWRVKDLAALLHSAPSWAGPGKRLRFLLEYGRKSGIPGREVLRELASRVLKKERRMASHSPKWD